MHRKKHMRALLLRSMYSVLIPTENSDNARLLAMDIWGKYTQTYGVALPGSTPLHATPRPQTMESPNETWGPKEGFPKEQTGTEPLPGVSRPRTRTAIWPCSDPGTPCLGSGRQGRDAIGFLRLKWR